ncbi:HaaA family cyclophane-containing RiPP peptide [Streptomyces flavidovirens]|uniref:HaaA family cyclophane-containing RiPP peptide n=1 Tax=Streptomyces flavidovirens TaxID=67298 RepID=UPI0033B0AEBA
MPPSTTVPSPSASATVTAEPGPHAEVLGRVAARVQCRLAAERASSNRSGDGTHAASLIWPWPL